MYQLLFLQIGLTSCNAKRLALGVLAAEKLGLRTGFERGKGERN
jgi:hypothetical protein